MIEKNTTVVVNRSQKDKRKLKFKEVDEKSLELLQIKVKKEKRIDQLNVASNFILITVISALIFSLKI